MRELAQDVPTYSAESSSYMKQFIKDHFGKDIDPDHTYLNEYEPIYETVPSRAGPMYPDTKRETGAGRLIRSTPLSQIAYSNLYRLISADSQHFHICDNKDAKPSFAEQKDVIDPRAFYKALDDLDFKTYYYGKLDRFYEKHGDDLRQLFKDRAQFEIDAQHAEGTLSDDDYALANRAFNPNPNDKNPPKVHAFVVNGYRSNDCLVIQGNGRTLLYTRGQDIAVKGFRDEDDLYSSLDSYHMSDDDLKTFAKLHFSANDAEGRDGGPGVTGSRYNTFGNIWHKLGNWLSQDLFPADNGDIYNDPFGHLVKISQGNDKRDAKFDITSNGDVTSKKIYRGMNYVPLPFAPSGLQFLFSKTKTQREDAQFGFGIDTISMGLGRKIPLVGLYTDYGFPITQALRKGKSEPDPGQAANVNDPYDPNNPYNISKTKDNDINKRNNATKNW
ncbi:MAG TPA: DUF6543 domain-containing protein [Dyella sp.]|uniref:dermonecrotic toxin domain-containing protein n=1 Tax=Dyella sp. TaxID=1869338 RepID=UPI002C0F2125|nr:DUF6543 domain-containing protein [Dyella sp.]HTV84757.1 DUF6543 domain-containing protein [Dyella sp.]